MLDISLIEKVAVNIQVILGEELIRLKRKASGAFINSLSHVIERDGDLGIVIKIRGLDYWKIINYGVEANKIPYTAGKRTSASDSKYINGLIRWIKIKGIASDNDVVRGIAFAIATKQTSKGVGWGLGNPMDKGKLGFIEKSLPAREREIKKLGEVYQKNITSMVMSKLPSIELTI
jgi:hypothetical protein